MSVNDDCDFVNIQSNTDILNVQYAYNETEINKESKQCMLKEQNESAKDNSCPDVEPSKNKDEAYLGEDDLKTVNIRKKVSRIVDSDSEEETTFISKAKKENIQNVSDNTISGSESSINSKKNAENKDVCNTHSDTNDSDGEMSNEETTSNNVQHRFRTLIDSESEEEDEETDKNHLISNNYDTKTSHKDHSKSNMRKVSLRASKEEAMKQIQSETQRLVRETEVCLPYHMPKQRTLQEFLNRKKVITVLPKAPTMAAKLKLSSAIVEKVLKEKEKEAEMFYKSSDSEEETSESHSSLNKENRNKENAQGSVSRRLFVNDDLCMENDKEENSISTMQKVNDIFTGTEKIKNNDPVVDNSIEKQSDLTILETQCEHNNAEGRNNENFHTSTIVEHIQECKDKNQLEKTNAGTCSNQENVHINDDKESNFETINEPSTSYTQINNNDNTNIPRQSLEGESGEEGDNNKCSSPPPILDNLSDTNKKPVTDIQSLKPKLRGAPGTIIDLSDDIKPNKKGIDALIDRFVCKHSKVNTHSNGTTNITSTHIKENSNGLSIVKETLPYKLPVLVDEDPKFKKPGAKLIYLKEELEHKMAVKRDEEWKQKDQELKEQEIEWSEFLNVDDNLSEPCSPSTESSVSNDDTEEDLYITKESKKSKCAFIEDEAEISDNDDISSDEIVDEEECEENMEEEDEEACDELEGGGDNSDDSSSVIEKKSFKRIRSCDDDSRSYDTEDSRDKVNKKGNMDQIYDSVNQVNTSPQDESSNFDFVSPATQLTALNVDSDSEKVSTRLEQSSFIDGIVSPLIKSTQSQKTSENSKCLNEKITAQKRIFGDHGDVVDEDLFLLCSGKFSQNRNKFNLSDEPNVTESQLLDVCSGIFSTEADDNRKTSNVLDKISQSGETSTEENLNGANNNKNSLTESKNNWTTLCVMSSDEEDLIEEINKKRTKKKKVKKLQLSDDEGSNSEDTLEESNSDIDDNNIEDANPKFIDYDSDENEIVVSKKDIKKYASKFLEDEAELSESDCDVSEDENEEDLDKLELEDVDNEEIDEVKARQQLDKLRMKQILDEDQKEVRLLKELLFEDGDLYSESNRERKFKWKNIDKQDENDQSQPLEDKDGWVDSSDDENEGKWRKIRYEREKFLAEKMENVDSEIDNELNDGQMFTFGMKVLKKRRINEFEKQSTLSEGLGTKEKLRIPQTVAEMLNNSNLSNKSSFINNLMQKHSFLAKGEETLARLAVMAQQKVPRLLHVDQRNFVFPHIDPPTEDEASKQKKSH